MIDLKNRIQFHTPTIVHELGCWSITGSLQLNCLVAIKLSKDNVKNGPTNKELAAAKREIENTLINEIRKWNL